MYSKLRPDPFSYVWVTAWIIYKIHPFLYEPRIICVNLYKQFDAFVLVAQTGLLQQW
jgi:hypothetical protein